MKIGEKGYQDFRFILLPLLAEQHEIVRRANALFARAEATKQAEAMTQSILAKAFAGRLW